MSENLNPGMGGWKPRQEAAQARMARKSAPDKAAIREARRALYARQAAEVEETSLPVEADGEAGAVVFVHHEAPDTPVASDTPTRDEMIARLRAAGQRIPPTIKDETLIARIKVLDDGE